MKKVLVLGGGSAGVMSAYTLKKVFPEKDVVILESENIPTVGVGESTLGHINQWMSMVDIHEEDFRIIGYKCEKRISAPMVA